MEINRITITGPDDKINPIDLFNLKQKYPFIEWGILFSESKKGQERYPTFKWIQELIKFDLELSAHFCGWYSREVLQKQNFDLIKNLHPSFKRIQLNYNFKNSIGFNLIKVLNFAEKNIDRSIILQYNKSNAGSLNHFILSNDLPENIHFLYDGSGGRGTEIKDIEDPIDNHYTGYSGGLTVDNISSICDRITNHLNTSKVWIDLESGARTNNQFDLSKVENILINTGLHVNEI